MSLNLYREPLTQQLRNSHSFMNVIYKKRENFRTLKHLTYTPYSL